MSADEDDTQSDEALVAAFLGGDNAAFDRLVERHNRWVYGLCYRYFGNPADAEDAAQDTFVAVFRRASTFTGAARFSTWLYRVTVNACNDLARARDRRPHTVPLASGGAPEAADVELPEAPDLLANRELGMELNTALQRLPRDHARTVVLCDVHGLDHADVAARLGVAVGTVKSRLHRARARLAAELAHLRTSTAQPQEPFVSDDPPTR